MLAKKIQGALPVVALIGRANVGKSTIFNVLTDKRQAITSPIAGTTRDANLGVVSWRRQQFRLVDTGGFLNMKFLEQPAAQPDSIDEAVQKQAREFITRADIVIMVVDAKDGPLPIDKALAKLLHRLTADRNNLLLVVNKADSDRDRAEAVQFYKLNLGQPQLISAITGSGTGDLLDLICERLKDWHGSTIVESPTAAAIKVCLLGKPNVGKSSLLNALSGFERAIVSQQAHTTREPQHTELIYREQPITIIDTAGIHKQGLKSGPAKTRDQKNRRLENQGIEATLKVLDRADIALLVVDIKAGLTKQEAKLVEEILARRKSLIIIANKWDLVEERDTIKYTQDIYRHLPFAQFVPIQFISAKTKEKVNKILDLILRINDNRRLEIPADQLKSFIERCVKRHLPTKGKGNRYPKIRRLTQSGSNPPEFAVKIGAKEYLADSYLNYLVNRLRESYDLVGTPINIWVEKANAVHGKAEQ